MGKLRIVLTDDELRKGYEYCKGIVEEYTGWLMSKGDFSFKLERDRDLSFDDTLTSNSNMTVRQYTYNKYFQDAKKDFGYNDQEASFYANECTKSNKYPNEFVTSFKIRDVGYY